MEAPMARALLASADATLSDPLAAALREQGYEVLFARDAASALRSGPGVELALWALPAPAEGALRAQLPGAQIVLVAARGDSAARAALEAGADELLTVPLDPVELALLLRRTRERSRERRARRLLGRELRRTVGDRPIVAASPAMIELLETLERVAPFSGAVLLRGERGTGKEGLARALHAFSPRRREPFVAVACAESPARALETDLFGRPGLAPSEPSRPGVLLDADGGTLFLDDVHALPLALQERLARVLRSEELERPEPQKPERLDLRVLAATSIDLGEAVACGQFRRDLYERIAAITLDVPSLRARSLDIPLLLDHFAAEACRRLNRPRVAIADDALERIVAYAWPGNLRELEQAVSHAVARAEGDRVCALHLPAEVASPAQSDGPGLGLRSARKQLEVEMIRRALRTTGGNRTHAARLLQISHRALLYKLKEHRID
jgi:two-component system response regulator AtoC